MTELPSAWKETPEHSETIFMVTGFMRSGTSMMMKALGAGGMPLAYEPKRDEMNQRFGDSDYQPNEGGFYEMERETYQHPDFPLPFKGRLIKGLVGCLQRLPVAKYKIVMMMRDPEEIRQSYEAFFNKPCPNIGGRKFTNKNYQKAIEEHIEQIDNRLDAEVLIVNYREVVEDPEKRFRFLLNWGRWPIDPIKAAAVVNPDKCRFRRENLEDGI